MNMLYFQQHRQLFVEVVFYAGTLALAVALFVSRAYSQQSRRADLTTAQELLDHHRKALTAFTSDKRVPVSFKVRLLSVSLTILDDVRCATMLRRSAVLNLNAAKTEEAKTFYDGQMAQLQKLQGGSNLIDLVEETMNTAMFAMMLFSPRIRSRLNAIMAGMLANSAGERFAIVASGKDGKYDTARPDNVIQPV